MDGLVCHPWLRVSAVDLQSVGCEKQARMARGQGPVVHQDQEPVLRRAI